MTKSMNRRLSQSSLKNANHKARDLRMESLEERQLLSVSPVSAASDDVDYACIAPAEMVPMESAPVVEINLTDEVPVKDVPVELAAYSQTLQAGTSIDFGGYNFTAVGSDATYETSGTSISISGNISITDHESDDGSVEIISDGTLSVEATLKTGSSISMTSGTLTVSSGCDVPTVTSSGITIEGAGTIGTLNLNGGTTAVTAGTVSSVTGTGDVTVSGAGTVGTFSSAGTLTINNTPAANSAITIGSANSTVVMGGYKYTTASPNGVISIEASGLATSGNVKIDDADTNPANNETVTISNSGTLDINTPLGSGSSVTNTGAVTTDFGGYTFTLESGATFEITGGNSVSVSGSVTVTDDTSTDDTSISINCASGNLTVNTTLAGTSYVDLASGSALSVASGKTVPAVNSNGGAISGDGTITTLDLTSGTTTVSGGTVGSTTGSGAVSVTGGSITSATSTGVVSVNGGTIGTVRNSTDITLGSGSITLVELKSGGATTTINGAGKITEVKSIGNSIISGAGNIGMLTLTDGTTTTVSGTTIDETSTGTGNLTVTGGKVTNSYTSGAISVSGGTVTNIENSQEITLNTPGTIGTVTLVSGTDEDNPAVTTINGSGTIGTVKSNGSSDIAGSGKIGTLTLNSGTTDVSGTTVSETTGTGALHVNGGEVTEANGSGAVSISEGNIGTVTNASGVQCTLNGKITTVNISGKTEVSADGEITEVIGTGATEITGGSIGTVTNTSTTNGVVCSGGQIGTVTIAGKTTVNGDNGIITTVNGTGATEISKGKIGTVENASSIKVTGGEITTSASTTGLVDISDGKIETVASAGSVKVTGGEITNSVTATGAVTVSDGLIGSVTSASSVSISRGSIGEISNTCAGTVGISGGTITTASSSGTITVDGGTITHVTSSATSPVIINGTTNADTIAVGQTVTIGSTSVTFDSGAVADVTINAGGGNDEITVTADPTSGALTINGGEGDDYIAVSADSNSGTLTINGEAGNDVIITGGLEATVDGQGNSDLIIAGKFTGNAATLKTWDGDAAKALAWSLDGTLSSSTVAAASASAAVNGDSTDVLYYNTTGAAPTVTGALALGLTTTSTTIIVTAENEADTSLSTITMAEAYAAMTATPGAYTLGFSHSEYIVNSALPVYANTTEANKLTIDGTKVYNAISGEGTDGAVTLKVGDFTPDSGTAYMMVGAGTYVDLKGLTFTKNAGSQAIAGINVAGTLKLTGGAKVTNFKSHGIENVSVNTLIVEEGEISGNTGSGIYNTGTAIIGTQGSTDAAAVQIFNNGSNGITNTGGDASLTIHNVTIYGHTASGGLNGKGVNNTNGATATIKGATASAINIYGNRRGVDNYGDDDPANTILTINSAYIHNIQQLVFTTRTAL